MSPHSAENPFVSTAAGHFLAIQEFQQWDGMLSREAE
jgi:hypothetical protein